MNGIVLDSSHNNATIQDSNASYNLQNGIYLVDSSYNTVNNTTASHNGNNNPNLGGAGILLVRSFNNTISNDTADNNHDAGIFVTVNSSNNKILNNSANNNDYYGIAIHHSPYNTIQNNTMSGNFWNFDIEGDTEAELTQYIDGSNTVSGSPILYLNNASNLLFDLSNPVDTGYFVNCFNITVRNLTFHNEGYPLRFWNTTDSHVENVSSYSNEDGLLLQAGSNNNTCPELLVQFKS